MRLIFKEDIYYFYVPFFVENTELHIGPRPKNSIYSGGQTSWQDQEEKEQSSPRQNPEAQYQLADIWEVDRFRAGEIADDAGVNAVHQQAQKGGAAP